LLILPQIIEIFKSGRVYGISYSLIILNLLGDAFKTFYFFYNVRRDEYRTSPSSLNYAGLSS
jgi:hypothetical protein